MSVASPVFVLRTGAPVLTYHDWPTSPGYTGRTYCGITLSYRGGGLRGTFLRLDHARKIGRPCSRCLRAGYRPF